MRRTITFTDPNGIKKEVFDQTDRILTLSSYDLELFNRAISTIYRLLGRNPAMWRLELRFMPLD